MYFKKITFSQFHNKEPKHKFNLLSGLSNKASIVFEAVTLISYNNMWNKIDDLQACLQAFFPDNCMEFEKATP